VSVDPCVSAEYLRKRFTERVWESGALSSHLHTLPEDYANAIVDYLVDGLLIEVGAL
jgi:hypothetical protein